MCAAKKIIRTQNGCQVSKDTTFGRCLWAKAHKLQLLYIFVLKVIEVYRQSVKKRRAISLEENVCCWNLILPISQCLPVYPGIQLHEKLLVPSTHVAPLAQEWLAHSLISIKTTVNSKKRSSSVLTSLYLKLKSYIIIDGIVCY